jgi:hypothetical protein
MQAELIAAATCADECKWFHNIFASSEEIFGPLASIPLLVDNQAALSTANHPLTTPKSKFVSLRDFRIRDYQNEGIVRPAWIPGKINPADGFTKLLGTQLSQQFTTLLGMRDRPFDDKETVSLFHFQSKSGTLSFPLKPSSLAESARTADESALPVSMPLSRRIA